MNNSSSIKKISTFIFNSVAWIMTIATVFVIGLLSYINFLDLSSSIWASCISFFMAGVIEATVYKKNIFGSLTNISLEINLLKILLKKEEETQIKPKEDFNSYYNKIAELKNKKEELQSIEKRLVLLKKHSSSLAFHKPIDRNNDNYKEEANDNYAKALKSQKEIQTEINKIENEISDEIRNILQIIKHSEDIEIKNIYKNLQNKKRTIQILSLIFCCIGTIFFSFVTLAGLITAFHPIGIGLTIATIFAIVAGLSMASNIYQSIYTIITNDWHKTIWRKLKTENLGRLIIISVICLTCTSLAFMGMSWFGLLINSFSFFSYSTLLPLVITGVVSFGIFALKSTLNTAIVIAEGLNKRFNTHKKSDKDKISLQEKFKKIIAKKKQNAHKRIEKFKHIKKEFGWSIAIIKVINFGIKSLIKLINFIVSPLVFCTHIIAFSFIASLFSSGGLNVLGILQIAITSLNEWLQDASYWFNYSDNFEDHHTHETEHVHQKNCEHNHENEQKECNHKHSEGCEHNNIITDIFIKLPTVGPFILIYALLRYAQGKLYRNNTNKYYKEMSLIETLKKAWHIGSDPDELKSHHSEISILKEFRKTLNNKIGDDNKDINIMLEINEHTYYSNSPPVSK